MKRLASIALVAAGAVAGCLRAAGGFHCTANGDCVTGGIEGTCEPVGYCGFPDSSCSNGDRYGALSGTLSNQCVAPALADAGMLDAPADAGVPTPMLIGPGAGGSDTGLELGSNSSCTFDLAVPAADNRFLVISVELSASPTLMPTIQSINYGGTPITTVIDQIVDHIPDDTQTSTTQYGLIGPPVGTATVDVELASPAVTIRCNGMTFSGVNPAEPVRAVAHDGGGAMSASVVVASQPGDLVESTTGRGDAITQPAAGQTLVFLDNASGCCSLDNAAGSMLVSTATEVSMGWQYANSDNWQIVAASLEPVP